MSQPAERRANKSTILNDRDFQCDVRGSRPLAAVGAYEGRLTSKLIHRIDKQHVVMLLGDARGIEPSMNFFFDATAKLVRFPLS